MEDAQRMTFIRELAQAVRKGDMTQLQETQLRLADVIANELAVDRDTASVIAGQLSHFVAAMARAGCPHDTTLFCPHTGSGCRSDETCIIYEIYKGLKSDL